jgi:uncharacterized protein (TIGR02145 family)
MNRLVAILCLVILSAVNLQAQNLMVVHQGNGTQLQIPLESIDSVRFVLVPPPAVQKIFQNNGNVLSVAITDIDSITYTLPNAQNLAQITTQPVTVLSATAAYGGGTISGNGGSAITQSGVCWSTSPNPTLANNFTIDGNGSGTFVSNILPLQPATTYFVRAYAVNTSGTAYGNTQSFTTQSASGAGSLPIIATNNVVYTDGLSATCGGNITADGGLAVTARGVCWAIGITPTINNSITLNGAGGGSFSSTITNLLPGTTYFVRAYATNDAGTAYGIAYSFNTHTIPEIITNSATGIGPMTAFAGGEFLTTSNTTVSQKGICWSNIPNPTISNFITNEGDLIESFSSFIEDLNPATNYFVRAYAYTGMGLIYGNEISFETKGQYINENLQYGSMQDIEGNNYKTIFIGNQEWFAENLRTSKYSNGDSINNQIDLNLENWGNNFNGIGQWAYYNNDQQYNIPYGKLYNHYSVSDSRNVCPVGWRVPSVMDYNELFTHLDSAYIPSLTTFNVNVGKSLTSAGIDYWINESELGNNATGFSALPGGYLNFGAEGVGTFNAFWTSSTSTNGWAFWGGISSSFYSFLYNSEPGRGHSIRCLRDVIVSPNIELYDGYCNYQFSSIPFQLSSSFNPFTGQEGYQMSIAIESILNQNNIYSKGICWSEDNSPTITDSSITFEETITNSNSGCYYSNTAEFFTGLLPLPYPGTIYYLRPYLITDSGVVYGNQIEVLTAP